MATIPTTNWSVVAEFIVRGIPKGQPRPRAFARRMGNKFVARVYDAGTAEAWKGDIARAAHPFIPKTPLDGPIRVDATFLMPRPKSLMTKKSPDGLIFHLNKPDRDNIEKAAIDALTAIGMWRDDSLVCAGEVTKYYHSKDGAPGAVIRISVPTITE